VQDNAEISGALGSAGVTD